MNLLASLKEQLKWTRLAIMEQLRTIFDKSFSSYDEKLEYKLSDGERSVRSIEKLFNIGRTKIDSLWRKWYSMESWRNQKSMEEEERKDLSHWPILESEYQYSISMKKAWRNLNARQ